MWLLFTIVTGLNNIGIDKKKCVILGRKVTIAGPYTIASPDLNP